MTNSRAQEAIKQTMYMLLVEQSKQFHPLGDEFAQEVEQTLNSMGWNLNEHDGPLSPFTQGAIELSAMQEKLTENGFTSDQAFELVKMIFSMNINEIRGHHGG